MNDIGNTLPAVRRERAESIIPAYDTSTFEHCVRIAQMYARASILPDHYKVYRREDGALIEDLKAARDSNTKMYLDAEATTSNVAIAVMQARSWNVDPFAMLQSAYVLHGRLGYEGKLVQAMLQAKLGVNFDFEYEGQGDNRKIIVTAPRSDGKLVSIEGTVGKWATKDRGGKRKAAWADQPDDMLRYRGVRQWGRAHEPNVMLGVYGDDELDELREDYKVTRPRVATQSIPQAAMIEGRAEQPQPQAEAPAPRTAPAEAAATTTQAAAQAKAPAPATEAPAAAETPPAGSQDKPKRSLRERLMAKEDPAQDNPAPAKGEPAPKPVAANDSFGHPAPEINWFGMLDELGADLQAAKNHDEALDRLAEFEEQDPPPPRDIRERAKALVEKIKPKMDWSAFVEDFKLRVGGAQTVEAVRAMMETEIENREHMPAAVWKDCNNAVNQRLAELEKPAAAKPKTTADWIKEMRATRKPEELEKMHGEIKEWCEQANASNEDRTELTRIFQSRWKLMKAQVQQ